MISTLYAILGFVFAIGLLTAIHEFGHFWVARRLGVKVLRFSVGFGKPLLSCYDKHGTEYVLSAIPLGGYVKMLDQTEGIVAPNEAHRAFNNKPVWARMLIIAAGPVFNLIFAVLAYWAVFMWGISSIVPVLGDIPKGSAAYMAELKSGEEIIAIDNRATPTWEDISVALVSRVGTNDFVQVRVQDLDSKKISDHNLSLNNWEVSNGDENILKNLGLEPYDPMEPVVATVMADTPAAAAGLEAGDRILSIDGEPISGRSQLLSALRNKYDRAVHLNVQRNQDNLTILITPVKKILDGGQATGYIGVQFANQAWPAHLVRIQRYTPGIAFAMGLERTKEYSVLTLQFLGKMITGNMSLQHIAGPISIAQFAGITAQSGVQYFLSFLAIVSISLGVLNMLPIPILDGGHFLFCCIELIRGRALSQRAIGMAHALGILVLGSVMILAVYNDLIRIMQ